MKITVINTGGTFNKKYNTVTGHLDVLDDHKSLLHIIKHCHNIEFDVHDIISKDSLELTHADRHLILKTINEANTDTVIVIHGTDTMDETAQFLDEHNQDKKVILTGAMTPMSIDRLEATINFSTAVGVLNVNIPNGIYIAMHGVVAEYTKVYKDKKAGLFYKVH